ncbi:hypothetical protein PENSPDRAFT_671873 [Peniophora sp. CONT]|nr:hypothetical protein PENSPDRAFT_671873 [Peniophora sp. CONT]
MPCSLRPVPSGCDDTFDWSNVRPIVPLKVPPSPKANFRAETPPARLEPCSATPNHSHLGDWNSRETTPLNNVSIDPTTVREHSTSPASPRITLVQALRTKTRNYRPLTAHYTRHTSSTPNGPSFSPSISNPGSAIVDAERGLYRPFLSMAGMQLLRHYAVERTLSSAQRARLADIRRVELAPRIHSQSGKPLCPLCDAPSTSPTNLIAHLHSGKHLRIRLMCDFCGRSFGTNCLVSHIRSCHPERESEYVQMRRKRERPVFGELSE